MIRLCLSDLLIAFKTDILFCLKIIFQADENIMTIAICLQDAVLMASGIVFGYLWPQGFPFCTVRFFDHLLLLSDRVIKISHNFELNLVSSS